MFFSGRNLWCSGLFADKAGMGTDVAATLMIIVMLPFFFFCNV